MQNQFIYPLRIHIEDTDITGLVYHSNYLNFMERARSEWIDELGMGIEWQRAHHIHFVVHSLAIQYLQAAKLHERVEVVTAFKSIRAASISFDQYLRLASAPDKLLCKAEIKIACVGSDMKACAIPDSPTLKTLRRALT